jgi:hypothetical protein
MELSPLLIFYILPSSEKKVFEEQENEQPKGARRGQRKENYMSSVKR